MMMMMMAMMMRVTVAIVRTKMLLPIVRYYMRLRLQCTPLPESMPGITLNVLISALLAAAQTGASSNFPHIPPRTSPPLVGSGLHALDTGSECQVYFSRLLKGRFLVMCWMRWRAPIQNLKIPQNTNRKLNKGLGWSYGDNVKKTDCAQRDTSCQ